MEQSMREEKNNENEVNHLLYVWKTISFIFFSKKSAKDEKQYGIMESRENMKENGKKNVNFFYLLYIFFNQKENEIPDREEKNNSKEMEKNHGERQAIFFKSF